MKKPPHNLKHFFTDNLQFDARNLNGSSDSFLPPPLRKMIGLDMGSLVVNENVVTIQVAVDVNFVCFAETPQLLNKSE